MNNIIEIKNIEVKYGSITALKDVSLSVTSGEIVCLIGANGSGKSTLLKAIVGLEPLSSGQIILNGETISSTVNGSKVSIPTHKIVSRGISMAPEGRGIFFDMTVLENLEMGAYLVKSKKIITEKINQMYDMFPILRDRRKQKAGSLSGGEQQMLSISRALMSSPKLLLLDEPALGLAPIIIQNIFESIVRINKDDGVTIFLVEQNAKMALSISTTGYVLETGRIIIQDKSSSLLEDPRVKSAYLGEIG